MCFASVRGLVVVKVAPVELLMTAMALESGAMEIHVRNVLIAPSLVTSVDVPRLGVVPHMVVWDVGSSLVAASVVVEIVAPLGGARVVEIA